MKTALVAGATGLIGHELLELLLNDPYYKNVRALTRKPIDGPTGKLTNIVAEFDRLDEVAGSLAADDIFCCLGTTMKKAGSREKFRKVDFDYTVALAKAGLSSGASQFLLVSAMGADKNSSFYYNQVKGEVEEAIDGLGYRSYHIFRPSLLLGHREEHRPAEEAAKTFYKLFGFLIPERVKGIEGSKVARAMAHYAKLNSPGRFVHDSKSMQSF